MHQTKQELLAVAKNLGIRGRHDMTRDQLELAVAAHGDHDVADATGNPELPALHGDVIPPERELVTREQHDEDMAFVDAGTDDDGELLEDDDSAAEAMQAAAESAARLDPEVTKDKKRRYPSEARRDSVTRKVIRRGVRFNLNVPFREKLYYLPKHYEGLDQFQVTLAAAPPQVRAIANTMLAVFSSGEEAARGKDIVAEAKRSGRLTSKIADDMLFAYYRRVLETVGVVHWDGDGE